MKTPGQRLRELRIERWELKNENGKRVTYNGQKATKEYIAGYVGITSKSLTAIEDGETKRPAREIIEAILDLLGQFKEVDMMDAYAVLTAYGYKAPIAPPSKEEGERAKRNWQQAYGEIWYPAYLLDIVHHVWAWNKFAPRLLGLTSTDPRTSEFDNVDILDIIFKLAPRYIEIVNSVEYLPGLIYTMKCQYQPYINEQWCIDWVREAQKRYPEFGKLWKAVPEASLSPTAMGNQVPIAIRIKPETDILRFQLTAVSFTNDPRFIVSQWIPVDDITAIRCLLWKKQEPD